MSVCRVTLPRMFSLLALFAVLCVSRPAAQTPYGLFVSKSSDRSSPVLLEGYQASDIIHVFVSPATGIKRVDFYLDDPTRAGAPRLVEKGGPWDFNGTATNGAAVGFNVSGLADGPHTITAFIVPSSGSGFSVTSNFVVADLPSQIHLGWVDDPSTTIHVIWRTRSSSTPSLVEYRRTGETTWQSVLGTPRLSGTTGSLHEVEIAGLTPGTAYEYRVAGGTETRSAVFTTRTAPGAGPADFDAVFVADTGVGGRLDGLTAATGHVIRAISDLNPLVVLLGGNLAHSSKDTRFSAVNDAIDAWFRQMEPVATRTPMMVSYGNQEVSPSEGYDHWAARFATPAGFDGRRNYSFDVGDAHFVSLFAVDGVAGLPEATLAWLAQDLAAAAAGGKRWIIPFFHVSPFGDGTSEPSSSKLRAQLGPLFEQYGVKIALSAHDQAYERSFPLAGLPTAGAPTSLRKQCYSLEDGVTWIKASPGGKAISKATAFSSFASEPAPFWTAARNNTLHNFVRVQVLASGSLKVTAYGVPADGTAPILIDSFQYTTGTCPPELYFEPSGLRFSATDSLPAPAQTVMLKVTGDAAADFSVTDTAPWLTVTPGAGSTPEELTAFVDPTNLGPGTYRAQLRAASPGFADALLDVVFSVYPTNTSHQLVVSGDSGRTSPTPLDGATVQNTAFIFVSPETDLKQVRFYLDDPNMSGVPFRIETGAPWDFNGTSTNGTAVGFNTKTLPQGLHTVTAATDMTSGGTTVLNATFVVQREKELAFERPSTSFSVPAGGVSTRSLSLTTTDGAAAAFAVTDNAPWLGVSPESGTTPGALTLAVDTAGLSSGTYSATVTATASGYLSGTHTVTMTVGSGGTATYQLLVSMLPDRSSPATLAGMTVAGQIYVFTSPTSGVSRVRFFLDDPQMTGTPIRSETAAPHDLAGGTTESALPYDTRNLTNAMHNLTAEITLSAGGTVLLSADFVVDNSGSSGSNCSPVPCNQILVTLPYTLTFSQGAGHILDKNGVGTGFRYIDQGSSGGYKSGNLLVDATASVLNVTTTSGSHSGSTNNLDNGLGVGVDAPSQVTRVKAVMRNPPAGTGNLEQAGLWFGNDADNYLKLIVLSTASGTVLEFAMEVGGVQTEKMQVAVLNLHNSVVELSLRADPRDRSIAAFYRVNGGFTNNVGMITAPPEFFSFDGARIDPTIGTDTFTGIFATHRRGPAPLVYMFDEFSVEVDDSSPPAVDPAGFTKASFTVNKPTAMAWGPDDRLYVSELFGNVRAFSFGDNKLPVAEQLIEGVRNSMGGSRLTLGLAIDPLSTPQNVILYVAHSNGSLTEGQSNSGTVTRLSGPNFQTIEHVITGLPRAIANHGQNSMHFGPDGRLYMAVGGNTGAGAPNTGHSEFGDMQEQPLSAAILVADVHDPEFDGSCHNATNIFGAPPCDVVPYATGFRNSYDFVFHSNGSLYATDNGLGVEGTFPPSPTAPCLGLANTASWTQGGNNPGEQPDLLFKVGPGGYHGHPNPHRSECVFKNGVYQGVAPPSNYVPPIFSLGMNKSANGIAEYPYETFFGSLKNELLVANYSVGDDVTRLKLSPDGNSVVSSSTLVSGFNDPLPLLVGPDGTIYVGELGGDRITALDPRFGRWFAGKPMSFRRHELGIAAIEHKVYVIGGDVGSNSDRKVEEYDSLAGTWRTMADLPEGLDHIGVAAVNGKIYVLGGLQGFPDPVSTDVYEFNPAVGATGQWTKISDMPQPVGGAAVAAGGGFIYVAGGFTGHHDASLTTTNFWRFDPVARTWQQLADIPTYRDHTRGEFIGGKFYVVGGRQDGSATSRLATLEAYDPATNTWETAPDMPDMPTPRRGISTAVLGGKLVVFGGEKNPETVTEVFRQVEEFDPVTRTWRNLAPMATPRHTAGAVAINGRVYVVGGSTVQGSGGITNIMEIFTFSNRP